jgi:hypothetical protein
MAKVRIIKCLLHMEERDRTNAAVMERLKAIEANMRKCSGALRKSDGERLKRLPDYWAKWMNGYGDHLLTLANEMTMIRTLLAQRLHQ